MKSHQRRIILPSLASAVLLVAALAAPRLRAQEPDPPAEVAKQFMSFLAEHETPGRSDDEALRRLVADKSSTQLHPSGVTYLLDQMQASLVAPHWVAETEPATAEGTTVVAKVAPEVAAGRQVVLVQEGRVWRVDLAETYARWNNLTAEQLAPILAQANESTENDQRARCQSNLKLIALGMMQYTQDYDEKYPPANKWCDVLQPYMKSEASLHCPAAGTNSYGYAMNWKMSKQLMGSMTNPAVTVMLYESTTLKRNQCGPGNDIAYRHLGGANYGFVDGHIKWFKTDQPQEFRLAPK